MGLHIFVLAHFFEFKEIIMKYVSDVTGCVYRDTDSVWIKNMDQAARYLEHGAKVYDIVVSRRDGKLALVFNKNETATLKELWDQYKLERVVK